MYIAVVKPISSICLFLIAVACLPLRAAEGEPVVVKSSSVANKLVSLRAELAGKETAFTCVVDSPPCSLVQPGEYIMVRAAVGEGIYNDCTNVVLYKSSRSSGAKDRIGVYCWLNDDCYIVNCAPVDVQTIPASVPDKIVDPSNTDTCKGQSRPDCRQAVAFFEEFQKAVLGDDRITVASMLHFPLRVMLQGKKSLIKNKSQLNSQYGVVFDSAVRCALAQAKRNDVWGNWRGFTVGDGVAWWERSNSPGSSFKVITVNNGAFYKGCGEPKR
jgi:hypothetical protein